jgi:hypothetical protein
VCIYVSHSLRAPVVIFRELLHVVAETLLLVLVLLHLVLLNVEGLVKLSEVEFSLSVSVCVFCSLLRLKTDLIGIFYTKHSPMPIFLKIARHV